MTVELDEIIKFLEKREETWRQECIFALKREDGLPSEDLDYYQAKLEEANMIKNELKNKYRKE